MASADGQVTLVFTDIEGSTHVLRALGARYADVLANTGAVLWSFERESSARTEAALRAELGDEEFAAASQEGRAMTPIEAVAEALGSPAVVQELATGAAAQPTGTRSTVQPISSR